MTKRNSHNADGESYKEHYMTCIARSKHHCNNNMHMIAYGMELGSGEGSHGIKETRSLLKILMGKAQRS